MRRAVALLAIGLLVLAACAVPRERDDREPSRVAAAASEVEAIFERYREVRNTAIELLDAKPLSTVESGPVLAIDSGSFEVAQRLSGTEEADDADVEISQVATPSFGAYPLWFMAEVRDPEDEVNRVQVFERASAVDPWLLVATPETVLTTELPELRRRDGRAVVVAPDDDAGMTMSAQDAADAYAEALADPESDAVGLVEQDDFVEQMRELVARNSALEGVEFSQSWAAEEVTHALRTADGGALVFANLLRRDTFTVEEGVRVTWPEDSVQQAFLSSGIATSGRLRYYHQVLVHVPGGDAKPRVLGQYGGVVDGDGF